MSCDFDKLRCRKRPGRRAFAQVSRAEYTEFMVRVPGRTISDQETDAILRVKRDWILRRCADAALQPLQIVAFGSAAKGRLREDSDIDIAVIFADDDEVSRGKRAVTESPREDLWPMDLLFYARKDFEQRANRGGVCSIIRAEGTVLFDRQGEYT